MISLHWRILMKIVVFSDSHAYMNYMLVVLKEEKPDMVLHLGDHITDGEKLKKAFPEIPMELVKGNTDFNFIDVSEKSINIEDNHIFLTHGDRYNVKNGITRLFYKGESINAKVILFGHTHMPFLKEYRGIHVMNPGCIGKNLVADAPSYGVMITENGKVTCKIEYVR